MKDSARFTPFLQKPLQISQWNILLFLVLLLHCNPSCWISSKAHIPIYITLTWNTSSHFLQKYLLIILFFFFFWPSTMCDSERHVSCFFSYPVLYFSSFLGLCLFLFLCVLYMWTEDWLYSQYFGGPVMYLLHCFLAAVTAGVFLLIILVIRCTAKWVTISFTGTNC